MSVRDLTSGELEIKLDSMNESLKAVLENMVTRALFDTWKDGNNDRIRRVEDDQKEWARVSTEAHVALDRDSKARHADTQSELKALDLKHTQANAEVVKRLDDADKDIRAAGRARVNIWIVAGLGVAATILTNMFWP